MWIPAAFSHSETLWGSILLQYECNPHSSSPLLIRQRHVSAGILRSSQTERCIAAFFLFFEFRCIFSIAKESTLSVPFHDDLINFAHFRLLILSVSNKKSICVLFKSCGEKKYAIMFVITPNLKYIRSVHVIFFITLYYIKYFQGVYSFTKKTTTI